MAKYSCKKCNGSGRSHFNQSRPGDMMIPIICECVVKKYNSKVDHPNDRKDEFDLLYEIVNIPDIKDTTVETMDDIIERLDAAEASGEITGETK